VLLFGAVRDMGETTGERVGTVEMIFEHGFERLAMGDGVMAGGGVPTVDGSGAGAGAGELHWSGRAAAS